MGVGVLVGVGVGVSVGVNVGVGVLVGVGVSVSVGVKVGVGVYTSGVSTGRIKVAVGAIDIPGDGSGVGEVNRIDLCGRRGQTGKMMMITKTIMTSIIVPI